MLEAAKKNFFQPSDIGRGQTLPKDSVSIPPPDLRKNAENLSKTSNSDPLESRPIFSSSMNFIKKNLSRAFWGLGFGSASLSVLSYFLIGSKILSLIFGLPTLMSFYIAHNLSQSVFQGKNNLFQNPLEQIKDYLENPQKIDSENKQALQLVSELKDMLKSKPNKEEILDLLNRFRDMLNIKYKQVQDSSNVYMSRVKLDTEKLLSALEFLDQK